jgi:hypothetical protein
MLKIVLDGADGGVSLEARRQALDLTEDLMARVAEAFDHEHTTMFNLVVPPEGLNKGAPTPQPPPA